MPKFLFILKKFWWALPITALVIALGFTRHTLASTKDKLATCNNDKAVLSDRLKTTTQSLNGALAQIDDNNRRIEAANAALQTAKQQSAADVAAANARWEAAKGSVAGLEASARDKSQPPCTVSQRALRALEGL